MPEAAPAQRLPVRGRAATIRREENDMDQRLREASDAEPGRLPRAAVEIASTAAGRPGGRLRC